MLQIAPTHWYSSNFTVQRASRLVADVDVSNWCEKAVLSIEGVRYEAYREGWLSRSRQIGSIAPVSCWTRDATSDLPETLPLHLRAFIIWLTMMQWRRDRRNSAA